MKALGRKDFSHINNRAVRSVRKLLNEGWVCLHLLFVPKEIAKGLSAVDALMKLIILLVIWLARVILYTVAVCLVAFTFFYQMPTLFLYGLAAFMLAQIIRIAQIEIEYMEDRGYLVTIFGSILTAASLAVAILSALGVISWIEN